MTVRMRCPIRWLPPLLCLLLAACGGSAVGPASVGTHAPIECAPFARALTGIALHGSAADWWPQAQGRYDRSARPEVGSALVFRRSSRLPDGHVSVVTDVVSPREVLVAQANWVHHHVTQAQPVIDVSPGGDWTSVRVWWPPSGQLGTGTYATFGFIRSPRPGRFAASVPEAIRVAEGR